MTHPAAAPTTTADPVGPRRDPSAGTDVRIRRAGPLDAELVDTMVREIARHEDSLDEVVAEPEDWRRLLARDDVEVFIATDGVQALGYASTTCRLNLWLAHEVLALDDLYVRESARNRGVGRELMMAVARRAATDDLTVVWGARLDNESAHRFYTRLGAHLTTKVVAAWVPEAYAWAGVDAVER
jgi:GNAT superfamily N-acetyltransferase